MKKFLKNIGAPRRMAIAVTGAVAVVATNASATTTTGPDFSGILTGIDGATAVAAIVAAAAILALVGFAKWGAKKVGTFFG